MTILLTKISAVEGRTIGSGILSLAEIHVLTTPKFD